MRFMVEIDAGMEKANAIDAAGKQKTAYEMPK